MIAAGVVERFITPERVNGRRLGGAAVTFQGEGRLTLCQEWLVRAREVLMGGFLLWKERMPSVASAQRVAKRSARSSMLARSDEAARKGPPISSCFRLDRAPR